MNKNELKPARVFEQFAKINEIPRPSKHEEKMIAYLETFAKEHHLEYKVDETGNVLIKKLLLLDMKTNLLRSYRATWIWFATNLLM